ncbi:MAG: tRNA ((37)-N6)-threonylcarbamoyltransferase complex ATPase subunit type 1 TsaE [Bacteroidota bacterium]|jgi:tRNA threonylcarbamoyladenosine biosynthesis protein TsaE
MQQKTFSSLTELPAIADWLIALGKGFDIWLFHGDMGLGKTTLIKVICAQLGVEEEVSSPTYAIVNEYVCKTAQRIYHFDFYRIKSEEEAYDIGAEEYLDSGNLCLIEWPSKIQSLIPSKYLEIKLSLGDDNAQRIIEVMSVGCY